MWSLFSCKCGLVSSVCSGETQNKNSRGEMDHRGRAICQGRAWWGRKRFSKNIGTSIWECGCPQHHTLIIEDISHRGSSCLHTIPPSRLLSHPPSASTSTRSLPSPSLSPSWSECLVTLQTKHHQPPADSHQHLLYQVIFSSIVPDPSKSHNHPAIFWLILAPGALPNITQHQV